MQVLLSTVIPVGLIVLIGFYVGKRFDLDLPSLSRLSIYVLVPALIFDAMYRAQLSGSSVVGLGLAFFMAYGALYGLTLGIARALGLSRDLEKSLVTMATFPNSGNMGLPMAQFAFGGAGYERAVVVFVASSVLMFGLGPAFLKGGGLLRSLAFTLRLPLFWALAAGLGLRVLEALIPPLGEFIRQTKLDQGVRLLGQACIPVLLLSLGMQIARSPLPWKGPVGTARVLAFELLGSFLRLLVAPALTYGVGLLLQLSPLDLQVLALQSAMSVAVNAFMMVREFGGDAEKTAGGVVLSTVLAFVTIPLVLWAVGVR
ncbi:MAG: transporter [Meiothermus sp.]